MFSLQEIKIAHDKVRSGTDFPIYIQELIQLGVKGYETIVCDGRVRYYGDATNEASTDKKYEALPIAASANKERFIEYLVMHQDGQTDYYTFCQQAAQSGIASWQIDILEMTCTYRDTNNNPIVIEKILL